MLLMTTYFESIYKKECIALKRIKRCMCPSNSSSTMDRTGLFLAILMAFACLSSLLKAEGVDHSCKTQCGDRCCPHENGVCCEGDLGCCQQGQICLSKLDTCIGLKPTVHGNVSLHSEKVTPVTMLNCPNGTTPCEGGCCPYADGVCCNDGTCCPSGYTCTPDTCVLNGVLDNSLKKGLAGNDPAISMMGRKLKNLGVQICPDKLRLCPGSTECCRKDNGQWDCCPKSSNLLQLKQGECCKQWGIKNVCCLDIAPHCHWWGCWY